MSRSLAESLGHQSWRSTVNRPWEYLFAYNEHLAAQYAELFDHPLQGQRSGTLSIEGPEGKRFYNYRVDPLSVITSYSIHYTKLYDVFPASGCEMIAKVMRR